MSRAHSAHQSSADQAIDNEAAAEKQDGNTSPKKQYWHWITPLLTAHKKRDGRACGSVSGKAEACRWGRLINAILVRRYGGSVVLSIAQALAARPRLTIVSTRAGQTSRRLSRSRANSVISENAFVY
jgi:hypothetical protein